MAARASWEPDPSDPASFDHLLQSKYGAIDIVPEVSGSYDELMPQAVTIEVDGQFVWVEAIDDFVGTLTVPRRAKDRERLDQLGALQLARPRRGYSTSL